ncbi:hypothetical protein [Collimonas pratensis]|uniref:hypothetical protein n=1 Tax=Collimonas pratensis TaxID=279113 RepID=UPI001431A77B|nr:hypothetical protein [Collimonas pratensis]
MLGSKHHLITEQKGISLAVILTGPNTHGVIKLLPLIEAIPAIAGKRGRPLKKRKCCRRSWLRIRTLALSLAPTSHYS